MWKWTVLISYIQLVSLILKSNYPSYTRTMANNNRPTTRFRSDGLYTARWGAYNADPLNHLFRPYTLNSLTHFPQLFTCCTCI